MAETSGALLHYADAEVLAELLGALANRLYVSRLSLCDRLHQNVAGKELFLRRLQFLLVREGVQTLPCFRGDHISLPEPHRHQSRPAVKTDGVSTAEECLRSSTEKPGWKNSSCSSVPWPMQVFITDWGSVGETANAALDAYEEDFGAVTQGIVCINPDILPYLPSINYPEENIASLFFINYNPHEFRGKCNCLTNLLDFFTEVIRIYDCTKAVDLVYIDFQKAFNKVPQARLMAKVEAHGIQGNCSRWIRSWLTGRTQRAVIHDQASGSTLVTSGVPQGSVLSPLLFITYINDLEVGIIRKTNKFADDMELCNKASKDRNRVTIQSSLNRLLQSTKTWQMSINIDKYSVIDVGTNNRHFCK
ncbi:Reverse transcriptase domain [Trinorchestia longiramus]|nr:Reverse transcriptase domain [Trinorchestia longiramus]